MPITGIYAAFIAILTCGVGIIDDFNDYNLISINNKNVFYLVLTTIFSANYWITEKYDVLIEIKQLETKK